METNTVKQQIIDMLDDLTPEQQAQLLRVANGLRRSKLPPGTPGLVLVEKQKALGFTTEDVNEMMQAIRDAEEIDWDGW